MNKNSDPRCEGAPAAGRRRLYTLSGGAHHRARGAVAVVGLEYDLAARRERRRAVSEDDAPTDDRLRDAADELQVLIGRAGLPMEDGGGVGRRVGPPHDEVGVLAGFDGALSPPDAR